MPLQLVKHEKLSLRRHPDFSELWLHDCICKDTAILGLGELDVIQRERPQSSGGRLDMLLADSENNIRYEVEVMLGATDPNHIVRCVEYWDIERRRYPAYEHVAVLIAEDITNRFLNFMSLLSGSIPLIAIQLDALRVGDNIVLNFVKVLDQRDMREEEGPEVGGEDVDRPYWEARKGYAVLQLCDRLLMLANEVSENSLQLCYKKTSVSISTPGSFFHTVRMHPKKNFVWVRAAITNPMEWKQRLEDSGLEARAAANGKVHFRITPEALAQHEKLLREFIHQVVKDFQS